MSSPGSGPLAKLVTIGVDAQGTPTCTPMTVDLWLNLGDTVKWVSAGLAFRITFGSGTPFDSVVFSGPLASSGSLKDGATGVYKYSIQIGDGVLDPDVKVHPP
jgi:hypothetical protein